jgi:ribosomal protein S27AE
MTSNGHTQNRELQKDARAWADFTGTKYTAALRQMSSPLAQGLLGERVSARRLVAALNDHELIGAHDGDPILGENGYFSEAPWHFNGETDFIQLALITDMLRMFTPISGDATPEVGSYSLKHTAEWFLSLHCSYVSNGRLIWAAAALGLPIAHPDGSGPNLLIGVSEREHDYVRRMVGPGQTRPNADHFRPAGYTHLQTALAQAAAGELITGGWVRPTLVDEAAPFHDWLILQVGPNDVKGDLARDYSAGVRDSDHGIARTPDELLAIFHEVSHSPAAYDAVVSTIAEWMRAVPSSAPVRTELIGGGAHDHEGWGAGAGNVERYEYLCPCGDGTIIEEHDNIPGFREHDVRIDCDKCRAEWRFVDGRSVRDWGLEPVAVSATV